VPKASSKCVDQHHTHPDINPRIPTNEHITQRSKTLPEFGNLLLVGLDLLTLSVLAATLLLGMETEILQKNNLAVTSLGHGFFDLLTHAILGECDLLPEKLLKLRYYGLEGVLCGDLAVWTSEVGHEDDGFCAMVDSVLDCWDGTGNALRVGNLLVRV